MARVAVTRGKAARGFGARNRSPPAAYGVRELRSALEAVYLYDAHAVLYVVDGATRQPRINKDGLASFPKQVEIDVFFCDVDNPGHGRWTPDVEAEAIERYAKTPALRSAGIYHTRHGARIVQPLAAPIPAGEEAEEYIRGWFTQLADAGLAVDHTCVAWNWHFRLPNVVRGGIPFRTSFMDLDSMCPIELESIPRKANPKGPTVRQVSGDPALPVAFAPVEWSAEVPATWRERVPVIAREIREVQTAWHELFLALSGALLGCGVLPEQLPAIVEAISRATGADDRSEGRRRDAQSTVERRLAGAAVTGYATLQTRWPEVAEAVDEALARGREARMRALSHERNSDAVPPLEETTRKLQDAIRTAPEGVTLIRAECGLGKTQAAIRVAAERASKLSAKGSSGKRAPLQSKTAISVDKTNLAEQVVQSLGAVGISARRIFGPLAVKRDDGTPECRYHEIATPLVAGGQAMQWQLCEGQGIEPCAHHDTCGAVSGSVGPDDARVVVGPHALLGPLSAAAGSTGLLVVDEPPPLLETLMFTEGDLETTRRNLGAFQSTFGSAMAPALSAITHWATSGEVPKDARLLADAIRSSAHAIAPEDLGRAVRVTGVDGDAVELAVAAKGPDPRQQSPPLQFFHIRRARASLSYATEVGCASRVLDVVHQGLRSQTPVVARVEQRRGRRVLLVTRVREPLARSLTRDGATVVLDAAADIAKPVLAKALGYEPALHEFAANDGAEIHRTLIWRSGATRRSWLPRGRLELNPNLVGAVRSAFDWAKEDSSATRLGLITMRPLRLALQAAWDPDDSVTESAWRNSGQSAKALQQAQRTLGPIVRSWPGTIEFGHYGAVRGLDDWKDVDCLITLGDPRPNLGDVRHEVAYLGLDTDWEQRVEDLCRAELEQAHGRLRAVHRTRSARALHVGTVLPGGFGWSSGNVEIRKRRRGRPANTNQIDVDELREVVEKLGGVNKACRLLGCGRTSLYSYLAGASVSDDLARAIRSLAGTAVRKNAI